MNILRETVLGRENFDFAFKEYARRWKFKRPEPADFFRTMEDASGVDLDWFWRGWFYSTDHVDISIENVRLYKVDTKNPDVEKELLRKQQNAQPKTLSQQRNENLPQRIDQYPSLRDLYNDLDQLKVTDVERKDYQTFLSTLDDKDKQLINANYHFYVVDLKNVGGLVTPLIFKVEYMDNTSEEIRIPAEIWRFNNTEVSKLIVTKKEAKAIVLDPNLETADADLINNFFPKRTIPTRFQVFKAGQGQSRRGANTAPTAPVAMNVAGKWRIAVDAGGQIITATATLVQDGNNITGTIAFPQGEVPITSGVMENGTFTIKTSAPFALTMKGQANGNQMSGSLSAPQGDTTFTGVKE